MKKDYPELEGKEITVYMYNGKTATGVIVGCCYDIGLSIVRKEDSNRYIYCLVGPFAPNFPKCASKAMKKAYKACFYSAVAFLKKGKLSLKLEDSVFNKITKSNVIGIASSITCAFNQ